jgi:hypothetical protein
MKPQRQLLRGFIPLGAIPRVEMPAPCVEELIVDRRTEWDRSVAEEAQRLAERCRRAQAEREAIVLAKQAEQQRALKRGAFLTQDLLIDETLDRYPLTDAQRQTVRDIIFRTEYSAEQAEIECLKIVAAKQEVREGRIAAVKALCAPEEWAQVQSALLAHRHQFSDEEVASGAALEIIYDRLFG